MSDLVQERAAAPAAVGRSVQGQGRLQRIRGRIGRYAAGASTLALGLSISVMAVAVENIYEKPSGSRFKSAPKAPDPQAQADAAAGSTDYILGVHINTIFFIAAAVIAVFWFTLGGGRKAKVTQHR